MKKERNFLGDQFQTGGKGNVADYHPWETLVVPEYLAIPKDGQSSVDDR